MSGEEQLAFEALVGVIGTLQAQLERQQLDAARAREADRKEISRLVSMVEGLTRISGWMGSGGSPVSVTGAALSSPGRFRSYSLQAKRPRERIKRGTVIGPLERCGGRYTRRNAGLQRI